MKKILVIGAGKLQISMIRRIKELGYEAYCVDKNSNAPGFAIAKGHCLIDVKDKENCLVYAKELGINAILTASATITLPTVSYIAEKMNLVSLCKEAAVISENKYLIKKKLQDAGANIYGSFFEIKSINQLIKAKINYPIVVKPSDGSGSKGVAIAYNQNELLNSVEYAFKAARYGHVYIENYIEGKEVSIETFVYSGKIKILVVVESICVRHDEYIEYGHFTPANLSLEELKLIKNEVIKAIRALNINFGSVNMDIIISNITHKPYIIDLGMRAGLNLISSHLIPMSTGVDIEKNNILASLKIEPDFNLKFNKPIATRILIFGEGNIIDILPYKDLIDNQNVLDIILTKKVGDHINEYKLKSDICGWVIASGSTISEANKNALKAYLEMKKRIIMR